VLGTADFAPRVCVPLLGTEADAAEDVLADLVESRLVEPLVAADGSVRFQLDDLVRLYASERLVDEETGAERAASLRRLSLAASGPLSWRDDWRDKELRSA
jgi:hypothetical protein